LISGNHPRRFQLAIQAPSAQKRQLEHFKSWRNRFGLRFAANTVAKPLGRILNASLGSWLVLAAKSLRQTRFRQNLKRSNLLPLKMPDDTGERGSCYRQT
jgi:hypothetical protein